MIEKVAAIFWFLVVLWAVGYSIRKILWNKESDIIKYNAEIMGFGLIGFIVISYVLSWLQILHWWIYLIIGSIVPLHNILKKIRSNTKISGNIDKYILFTIIVSLIVLLIMIKGAFVYPYLEDDDSWDHASAAYHISSHNTAQKSSEQLETFGRLYMDPYPPAYPFIMGALTQLTDDVYWTLKVFNSLLIFFAPIFFYLLVNTLMKSKVKAFIASTTIAILPSFMNHFIWSQTLAVLVLIFGAYLFMNNDNSWQWIVITSVAAGTLILTQQSTAIVGYIMFAIVILAYVLSDLFSKKRVIEIFKAHHKEIYVLLLGILFSLVLFYGPMLIKYGPQGTLEGMGFSAQLIDKDLGDDTSGGVIYSFKDILYAPLVSKMDQATGTGYIVGIVSLIALVLLVLSFKKASKKEQFWIILGWLLFTFIGLQSNALPIRLFPHRFWVFFSIPIAILFAEGIYTLKNSIKNRSLFYILLIIIVLGVGYTSIYPKYIVQTSYWPAGGNFASQAELQGYVWMKDNLEDKYVFNMCGPVEKVIGLNMHSYTLDLELEYFRRDILSKTPEEVHSYLKSRNFEYFVIDSSCIREFDINQTNTFSQNLGSQNTLFEPVNMNEGFLLFRIK